MKDSEFIELLNLYLDHEISAKDAARLEAEVQNNPARRQIYRDYCRMQKACAVLAQDFQTEAPATAERKVVAFETATRRSRLAGLYTVGTFAAAACIAVVFVSRNREANSIEVPNAAPVVAQKPSQAPVNRPANGIMLASHSESAPVAQTANLQVRPMQQPALAAHPLSLAANARADALAAAVEEANAQFAWMRAVQLAPMQQPVSINQLRFESQPALRVENRTYGNRQQPGEAAVELSAFRFQR